MTQIVLNEVEVVLQHTCQQGPAGPAGPSSLVIPFITASLGIDNISLTGTNEVPFFDTNSFPDNIGLI